MTLQIPTSNDLYLLGQAEVLSRQDNLTDWNEGSVLDALMGANVLLTQQNIRMGVEMFAKQFFSTAELDDLDALAYDRLLLTRNAASFAVGTVTFTRGVSVGDFTIPAGTTVQATVNSETIDYTTDSDATILSASSVVDTTVTAGTSGRAGNVAIGVVTNIPTPVSGDADLTVTNAARMAGGSAEETDSEFRERIARFPSSFRQGTIGALETAALAIAGVSFAAVDESTITNNSGYVSLYVGDPDGTGNGALAALVETAIEDVRSAGVEVRVFASAREEISIVASVFVDAGTDQTTLTDLIRSTLLDYTDNLNPNETLYISQAEHRIHEASDAILSVVISTPSGDYVPTLTYNAIRVPSANLTINYTEVT